MLYKIPAFNDVQYSCMRCCILVCFALICCTKDCMYIILVGVLYLILMYTSIATQMDVSLIAQDISRTCRLCVRGGLGGWRTLERPYFLAYYDGPPSREGRDGENRGRAKRQTAQTEEGGRSLNEVELQRRRCRGREGTH